MVVIRGGTVIPGVAAITSVYAVRADAGFAEALAGVMCQRECHEGGSMPVRGVEV